MTRTKAFTLVETLLASTLSVFVVGALVGVYGFVTTRTMHTFSRTSVELQAQMLARELALHCSEATKCEAVPGPTSTALKCTIPAIVIDVNNDGELDECRPNKIRALSYEQYDPGQRVWFYFSDATGDFSRPGTVLHKAIRMDDAAPTASDSVAQWRTYPGGSLGRWSLVTTLQVSVDTTWKLATFTVKASSLNRAERVPAGGTPDTEKYDHTITRTVAWRNSR